LTSSNQECKNDQQVVDVAEAFIARRIEVMLLLRILMLLRILDVAKKAVWCMCRIKSADTAAPTTAAYSSDQVSWRLEVQTMDTDAVNTQVLCTCFGLKENVCQWCQ
jgi:hypothetical protein